MNSAQIGVKLLGSFMGNKEICSELSQYTIATNIVVTGLTKASKNYDDCTEFAAVAIQAAVIDLTILIEIARAGQIRYLLFLIQIRFLHMHDGHISKFDKILVLQLLQLHVST